MFKLGEYDWVQDINTITIFKEFKRLNKNKIKVTFYSRFLKIFNQEKNNTNILDLFSDIKYYSQENKIFYLDDKIKIVLIKENADLWDDLKPLNKTKNEIINLRKESILKFENYQKTKIEEVKNINFKYGSKVTNEQMKIDEVRRNEIEKRKKDEYEKAINEIEINKNNNNQINNNYTNENNEIWNNEEKEFKKKKEYKIRETKDIVNLKFTEKIFPALALRETQFFEAPVPKNKKEKGKESQNYLWLKDKGDEYLNNRDFVSALHAYSECLKIKEDYIKCLNNRSVCYFLICDFENSLNDTINFEKYFNLLTNNEKENEKNKLIFLNNIWRMANNLIFLGRTDDSIKIFEQILKIENIDKNIISEIEDDLKLLNNRKNIKEDKSLADKYFIEGDYLKSKEYYNKILNLDQNNEIILSNLSLIEYNQENFQECINLSNNVINILNTFETKYSIKIEKNNKNKSLFILLEKNILRKTYSFLKIEKYEEAKESVNDLIKLDINNKKANNLRNQINSLLNIKNIENLKIEGNELIKLNKIKEAKEKYDNGLKLITNSNIELFCSLLLNRCVCNINLENYNEIINDCTRGLKLIENHENKLFKFEKKDENQISKEKLTQIKVRLLIRRLNSFLKLNQLMHAKKDCEEVLKIDPNIEDVQNIFKKFNVNLN